MRLFNYDERRFTGILLAGMGVLALVAYSSLSYGILELSFFDVCQILLGTYPSGEYEVLIYQFRLPRIVIAALVGAGLGVSGAVLQGISRNGLADPGILGVNAGAGFAMVIFMFFYRDALNGANWLAILAMPFFGLIGGLAASLFVYLFSWKEGRLDSQRFLLNGIALGSGLGALSFYLTLKMNPADFHAATAWSMGSLLHANWKYIVTMVPWFLVLVPIILWKTSILDLFQLEESTVRSLGVRVEKEQGLLLLCSTGLVSVCVAVAGNIGFVGLIVPHLARSLIGMRHDRIIPFCGLLGMLLVILADFVAKNLFAPVEIAAGVVIALIGVPYFIYLLFKSKA